MQAGWEKHTCAELPDKPLRQEGKKHLRCTESIQGPCLLSCSNYIREDTSVQVTRHNCVYQLKHNNSTLTTL
ncbi:hypothetical protein HHUSO_G17241 [Huso huso]|uniref:Uncharacterized protein n=1 Tax=Huso huso TaxID=61971 RepID=A0ABR0Z8H5_HUSHU